MVLQLILFCTSLSPNLNALMHHSSADPVPPLNVLDVLMFSRFSYQDVHDFMTVKNSWIQQLLEFF